MKSRSSVNGMGGGRRQEFKGEKDFLEGCTELLIDWDVQGVFVAVLAFGGLVGC